MKYIMNPAGKRVVQATPEETRALRPAIIAAFRKWRANEGDLEDFAQDVEIIVWVAVQEQRIPGDGFKRPVDALLDFCFAVGWNLWRNHSRRRSVRCEALVDELPDLVGPSPVPRLEAREALLRLTSLPDITTILLEPLNIPASIRYTNVPKSTYCSRVVNARKEARAFVDAHSRKPVQPVPPTPRTRKKKR